MIRRGRFGSRVGCPTTFWARSGAFASLLLLPLLARDDKLMNLEDRAAGPSPTPTRAAHSTSQTSPSACTSSTSSSTAPSLAPSLVSQRYSIRRCTPQQLGFLCQARARLLPPLPPPRPPPLLPPRLSSSSSKEAGSSLRLKSPNQTPGSRSSIPRTEGSWRAIRLLGFSGRVGWRLGGWRGFGESACFSLRHFCRSSERSD